MCSITASAPSRPAPKPITWIPAARAPEMSAGVSPTATVCSAGQSPARCRAMRDQLGAVLGVASERALAAGEEVVEADDLHPRSSHRLGVSGQERAMLDLAIASAAPRRRASRTCRRREQLEVASEASRHHSSSPASISVVGKTVGPEQQARDSRRRLPRVIDVLDRVVGEPPSPDRLDRLRRRLSHERIARHEQRLVDVEENEQHAATIRATYGGDQVSTWSILRLSCKPRSPVGLVKQPGQNASAKNNDALALAA